MVGNGAVLATVTNELVDDSNVHELQQKFAVTQAERDSLVDQKSRLEAVRVRLTGGATKYQSRRVEQLNDMLAQARAKAEGERVREEQAASRFHRAEQLRESGLIAEQELEEATRDKAVSERAVQEAEAGLRALTTSLESTRDGTNLDTTTDKPYSRQRLDDVELRLVEVSAELAERERQAAALAAQLEIETTRLQRRSQAQLVSPFRGRLWHTFVNTGEYITAGKDLFELIDCSRLLVTALVNERNYRRLRIGTEATFSFLNSKATYAGRVVQLPGRFDAGRFENQQDVVLAQAMDSAIDVAQQYTVVLAVPDLANAATDSCEIGQLGEVHFDVSAFSR
jgi:multidrug resistance efflux pump